MILEDEENSSCSVYLLEIQDASIIRKKIMGGQVEASLLKPQLVGLGALSPILIQNMKFQYYR